MMNKISIIYSPYFLQKVTAAMPTVRVPMKLISHYLCRLVWFRYYVQTRPRENVKRTLIIDNI